MRHLNCYPVNSIVTGERSLTCLGEYGEPLSIQGHFTRKEFCFDTNVVYGQYTGDVKLNDHWYTVLLYFTDDIGFLLEIPKILTGFTLYKVCDTCVYLHDAWGQLFKLTREANDIWDPKSKLFCGRIEHRLVLFNETLNTELTKNCPATT